MRLTTSLRTRRSRRSNRGFTLVELLLVISLVLMLASAMVFNFSNLMRGNQLEEGTVRLETLMRFARATAANSGRKVQIVFNSESTNTPAASTGEVRATWEPDPLGQPGCFSDLGDAQWHLQEINDLVQVESVKLLDQNSTKPTANVEEEDFGDEPTNATPLSAIPPITFYPDGSSDSAEIIVAGRAAEEDQRMAVRLVGITGSISHQLLTADVEDILGETGPADRAGQSHRESVVRDLGPDREKPVRMLNSRPVGNSSRLIPSASPRPTIGDTNTVDQPE